METIAITGSGGYLGENLIQQLIKSPSYTIAAMSSQAKKLEERYKANSQIYCFENDFFKKRALPLKHVDVLVHLAFARRFSSEHEIAESIDFSRCVFETAKIERIPKIIYVSSQGIYGNTSELRTVGKTKPSPTMIYTMAKYATEQVLWSVVDDDSQISATVVRLDSIAGNQKMLPTFVQNCIENQHISVVGGNQIFSFLDVRDAASGLISLLKIPSKIWKPVYNLGANNRRYNILELATLTAEVAQERGFGKVTISVEKKDIAQFAGMDSDEFSKDTGWLPRYDMKSIISKLFDEYLEKKTERKRSYDY